MTVKGKLYHFSICNTYAFLQFLSFINQHTFHKVSFVYRKLLGFPSRGDKRMHETWFFLK